MILIWMIVVILTFYVPFQIKIALFVLNFFLPDVIPFVDEIMQLYSIFNSSNLVKGAKVGNGLRKLLK